MAQDFRLTPSVGARFVGAAFVVIAVLVLALTLVAALVRLPFFWVLGLAAVLVLAAVAAGTALHRLPAVRMDDAGYAVHWLRGVGVRRATWAEVEEANTASQEGLDLVVVQLTGDRTTTIPLAALAATREEFVTGLRDRLKRARPTRPLGSLASEPNPDSAGPEGDR
jgi:hypothetical protein